MLFDIISLIIIIVFLIIGYKVGAAKVIGRFAALVFAFISAVCLSRLLANFIYYAFIHKAVLNNITSIANDSGLATAAQKTNELLSSSPAFFANILSYFNINDASFSALFNESAISSIENAFMVPVVAIISLILFIILFGVILFLSRKLVKILVKLFRLPLIKVFDSAIGLIFGLIEGILIIYILAITVSIIIPFTNGNVYILNEEYINKSLVFTFIYSGNIVSFLQNLFFSIGK